MFGKSKPSADAIANMQSLAVESFGEPSASLPLPAAASGLQSPAIKPSVISDAVSFVGEFTSKGALHIDGSAKGTIEAESVTVGSTGSLNGKVRCRKLHVRGSFAGSVFCDELIIADDARVEGEMTYRTILVQRGAHVVGEFFAVDRD